MLRNRGNDLIKIANPIMNKPKPAPAAAPASSNNKRVQ
jgi:hypothetical protein